MSDIPLSIVVAVARNGVIGRGNDLPWRIPSDLKNFKATTLGKPVIMGRRTWDSLPRKPLPGRANFVVSRKVGALQGATVCNTPEDAVRKARQAAIEGGAGEACLIGGAALYEALLPLVARIYLTEVDLAPEGDAHFPVLDPREWREVSATAFDPQPGDDAGFVVRVMERV